MELSGLIFVALAVAWAVYLIPKALQHHDEHRRSRPVERFSASMRVLARREAVSSKKAKFVVNSVRAKVAETRANAEALVAAETSSGGRADAPSGGRADARDERRVETTPPHVRRSRNRKATKRRRRVLVLLLLANVAVATCAGFHVFSWWYAAIPAGLLLAWLVLCRVMVRSERGLARRSSPRAQRAESRPGAEAPAAAADVDLIEDTASHPAIEAEVAGAEPRDPNVWDPVPMQLPTYVGKASVRRTVRTIDIDDSGVWSSGRSEVDSALAREAEEAERARKADAGGSQGDDQRAVGS